MIHPTPPFEIALLIVIGVLSALAAIRLVVKWIVRHLRSKYGNS